jgi:hypothetical protein
MINHISTNNNQNKLLTQYCWVQIHWFKFLVKVELNKCPNVYIMVSLDLDELHEVLLFFLQV